MPMSGSIAAARWGQGMPKQRADTHGARSTKSVKLELVALAMLIRVRTH